MKAANNVIAVKRRFPVFDRTFSNSLIIHKPKTKEITTVKEVWICGLN